MVPDALTRTGASPKLIGEALCHAALIRRLVRLADLDCSDVPYGSRPYLGSNGPVLGELVVLLYRGLWRHAVVLPSGNHPKKVRCVLLAPSALDRAQRTWAARSRELLGQQQLDLLRNCDDDEFRKRVFAIAVATMCPRGPWAAVVPPVYLDRDPGDLRRAQDQTSGEDPLDAPALRSFGPTITPEGRK